MKNKTGPSQKKKIGDRINTFDSISALYEGRKLNLISFRIRIFPKKATKKVMDVPRSWLTVALAQQVKAGNTSEKLPNEIGKFLYSLYWTKEMIK